jgi:MoaA/NifB/PqqE/SkfB family radical SAM enzyme
MKPYKIAINMEWTSKCNARCVMCPQSEITHPMRMEMETFDRTLERLKTANLFRVVVAGYGEPTTHPHFIEMVDKAGRHPARFDMVSNGQLLDEEKLRHIDGRIGTLVVSFSSIDPDVYRRVHVNLDHETVKDNILLAKALLRKTRLAISLTPLQECMDSLDATIAWFRRNGIQNLSMSPTLYNRGGSMEDHRMATSRLRALIESNRLHSQELDFVPALKDIARQWLGNDFKCIPRNVDLFVAANGDYLYCYNDIAHKHAIGNVHDLSIDEALSRRECMGPMPGLCEGCNMRGRYGLTEVAKVAARYAWGRWWAETRTGC